jgi:hydrogenase expression/formation protein HypE
LPGLDPSPIKGGHRFVAPQDADRAITLLRDYPVSADAAVIDTVGEGTPGRVSGVGALGFARAIDMLNGEQLPRIC